MKNSVSRTLCWSAMVITGGFGIMELLDQNYTSAALWLAALAAVGIVYAAVVQKKVPASKTVRLESLLEPETLSRIKAGQTLAAPKGVALKPEEKVYWYDFAAQDYYEGKQGLLVLTSQRLIFNGDGFRFLHPLSVTAVVPTRNGIEIAVKGRKMKMVTASTPVFLEVWSRVKEEAK